jgi:hypothetical protein
MDLDEYDPSNHELDVMHRIAKNHQIARKKQLTDSHSVGDLNPQSFFGSRVQELPRWDIYRGIK